MPGIRSESKREDIQQSAASSDPFRLRKKRLLLFFPLGFNEGNPCWKMARTLLGAGMVFVGGDIQAD